MFAALQLYQINHLLTSRCFLESRKFPCNKLLLGLIFKENVYATVLNALEQFYPEAEEVFFFFFFFLIRTNLGGGKKTKSKLPDLI